MGPPTPYLVRTGCLAFTYPGKNIPHSRCTDLDAHGRCWVKNNLCCCAYDGPPGWTAPWSADRPNTLIALPGTRRQRHDTDEGGHHENILNKNHRKTNRSSEP